MKMVTRWEVLTSGKDHFVIYTPLNTPPADARKFAEKQLKRDDWYRDQVPDGVIKSLTPFNETAVEGNMYHVNKFIGGLK